MDWPRLKQDDGDPSARDLTAPDSSAQKVFVEASGSEGVASRRYLEAGWPSQPDSVKRYPLESSLP